MGSPATSFFTSNPFHHRLLLSQTKKFWSLSVWDNQSTARILILRSPLTLSKGGLQDHFWTVQRWSLITETVITEIEGKNSLDEE